MVSQMACPEWQDEGVQEDARETDDSGDLSHHNRIEHQRGSLRPGNAGILTA